MQWHVCVATRKRHTRFDIIAQSPVRACRAPVPGQKIGSDFRKAFADDATSDRCAADPLVLVDAPPRLRFSASCLGAMKHGHEAAAKVQKPVLVRTATCATLHSRLTGA